MSQTWIALIGTIFGGAGFKIIEHILARTKKKDDTATMLRSELRSEVEANRKEISALRKKLDSTEAECDSWRNKYYALVGSIAAGDLDGARKKIIEGK